MRFHEEGWRAMEIIDSTFGHDFESTRNELHMYMDSVL